MAKIQTTIHKPIHNLGNFAHPPKAQTKADVKLIGPKGDKKHRKT